MRSVWEAPALQASNDKHTRDTNLPGRPGVNTFVETFRNLGPIRLAAMAWLSACEPSEPGTRATSAAIERVDAIVARDCGGSGRDIQLAAMLRSRVDRWREAMRAEGYVLYLRVR